MFRYNYESGSVHNDTTHKDRVTLKLRFTFQHSISMSVKSQPKEMYIPKHRTDCIITKFNGLDSNGRELEEHYASATVFCYFKDTFSKKMGCRWALKKAIEGFSRESRAEIWSIFNRMSNQGRCEVLKDGYWFTTSFQYLKPGDIFTLKFGKSYGSGAHVSVVTKNPTQAHDSHGNLIWNVECIPLTMTNISETFFRMLADQFSQNEIIKMIKEAADDRD